MKSKVFGKLPKGDRLERISRSPQFRNGSFQNIESTPVMSPDSSWWQILRAYWNKPAGMAPSNPLPFLKTDLHKANSQRSSVLWFGHSSYLVRLNGINILVDPVFSGHASPVPFMVKAYAGSNTYSADDMPPIDLLVQTHDHYDNLDHGTVTALQKKTKQVIAPLGVGAHFEHWGYSPGIISELDWWESAEPLAGIKLTAVPGRHFSGRGLSRGKTLWAGFVLKTPEQNLFLGGDSGYSEHFREIGQKYGPFDLVILECGQYNKHWPFIHMMPEQTAQAAVDLGAKLLLPVHWAKFTLSLHPWNEPIQRVLKKAFELGIAVTTPKIGEPVELGRPYPVSEWWK